MNKEMMKMELETRKIIEGVLSGDISTETYDFRDVEYKKKTLANYLTCNIEDIAYNEERNLFVVGNKEYNVLYEDEAKVQKIINMYYDIKFECFFIRPKIVADILNISIDEVIERYEYSDDVYDCIDVKEILNHNYHKISINEFIEKADKVYSNDCFLSYQDEEIKREDLFIYDFNM